MEIFFATICTLFVLFCLRAFLAQIAFTKELEIAYNKSIKAIDEGRPYKQYTKRLEQETLTKQILDLSKWTHKQFYPEQE